MKETYGLVPCQLLFWQLVALGMLEEGLLQLGKDRLELLQCCFLRHFVFAVLYQCKSVRVGSDRGKGGAQVRVCPSRGSMG